MLVDVPARSITRHFDYAIPEALEPKVQVGSRVLVPFGGRRVSGFVLELADTPDFSDCKEIFGVAEDESLLPYELLELAQWMSKTYVCSTASCLRVMLPPGIRIEGDKKVELLDAGTLQDSLPCDPILSALAAGPKSLKELGRLFGNQSKAKNIVEKLEKQGTVAVTDIWTPPRVKGKTELRLFTLCAADKPIKKLTQLQQRVYECIAAKSEGITQGECVKLCRCTPAVVKKLVEKELVEFRPVKVLRKPNSSVDPGRCGITLTPGQSEALNSIVKAVKGCDGPVFLLKGVTGSGKTEVYLRAIEAVLDEGREAIVLVPEISLTPQTVARFKGRFGDKVAVLHSKLSQGERYDEWVRIRSGEVSVVVGARSAVFAPFSNLGIIIIDEEHEPSYKQDEDPKYHAVEVAKLRAELASVPLVLGSATPSTESYYNWDTRRYELLELAERVDSRELPPVSVVDMRTELKSGNKSIFSRELQTELDGVLSRGDQAIIFLNRRGFNTFVMCRECGHVMRCQNCDVSLTFHSDPPMLLCHYCNVGSNVPVSCPNCGSRYIKYFGTGTQKVESELQTIFPAARTVRMDVDTTRAKDSHARILGAFERREADILVGTQMIAKGLDFPGVTLVGVIAADTTLNLPDYRAAERTFQLLTQVAGRAGRGRKPGKVVVQTYNPEHYAIQSAMKHDYDAFYKIEIGLRRDMDLPPFTEMAQVVVSDDREEAVIRAANGLAELLRGSVADRRSVQVIGPAPAPISKVEGRFRWQLVLKAANPEDLQPVVRLALAGRASKGSLKIQATIRPINLL